MLKSNSSSAAAMIIGEIAHDMHDPKRIFELLSLCPEQAKARISMALAFGDYELIALISMAQASKQGA